jgi:cell division protein FtsQ
VVWIVGALGLLASGAWVVEFSPLLVAHLVRVEGVPAGDVSTIVGRAEVPLGTPLARVDMRAIARRVIGAPTLAEVSVSRSWPSTVVIWASLRLPVLAVVDPQGQVQVVDSQGVAYATVSEPPKGVPLVSTVENPSSKESMRAAISVLQALSASQRAQVSDVSVLGANMVTFRLGEVTVLWGGASQPALKVKVMTVLLRQKGIGTIDVSAPDTPAVR